MTDLTPEIAALIKGMLARGDKQQDIAACFGLNSARVNEIKRDQRAVDVIAALPNELPPPPPYPSPYDLWRLGQAMWGVRVALEAIEEKIQIALKAVHNAEMRSGGKK